MKSRIYLIIGSVIISFFLNANAVIQADDFIPADEENNAANTIILDADDTGGDITLQFGATLAEFIKWNSSSLSFDFSDETLTLDSGNTGVGADVNIIANQGSDSDGTLRYNATDNRWKISNDAGNFHDIHQATVFYAYDNTGGQSISGTEITVNIDTTVVSDSIYTLATDEVTVSEAGLYKIKARVAVDDINTTGGARYTNEIRLQKNAADIAGAVNWCYARETTSNTCELTIIETLSASDVIRIRSLRTDGTTNSQTRATGSSLTIERIR